MLTVEQRIYARTGLKWFTYSPCCLETVRYLAFKQLNHSWGKPCTIVSGGLALDSAILLQARRNSGFRIALGIVACAGVSRGYVPQVD